MAKDVEIKIKVVNESGDIVEKTVKSMKELETEAGKLKDALANAPLGSDKFKELNTAVKDADKTITKTKASTMSFSEKLNGIGGPIGGVIQGIQGMSKAALAFVANPIGAIIAAIAIVLGTLYKALNNTEKGLGALNKITAMFGELIDPIIGAVEELANLLAGALAVAMEGFAKALSFFGIEAGNAATEAGKLSEAEMKLEQTTKDAAVSRAKTNQQLAETKEILSDSNATYEERVAALNKVKKAESEQSAQEVRNAQKSFELAQRAYKMHDDDLELRDKMRDAEIALAQVQQDAAAQQRAFNKQQKALDKEVEDAAKAAAAEAEARAKAAADKAKARRDAALSATKEALKAEQKAVDEAYLLSIDSETQRAQEALKIQQRNQDSELQLKISQFENIKKRTAEENATLAALKAQQAAEDHAQQAQTNQLLEKQAADAAAKKLEDDKKAAADAKALKEKEFADTIKATDDYYKQQNLALIQQGLSEEALKKAQGELEIQRLEQQITNAKDYGQQTIDLELALAAKRKEITDADIKATEDAEKKKAEIRMQQFQGIMTAASSVTNAVAAIQEAQLTRELNAAGGNLAKQEEIKKKYFEKGKKTQIANAIIGTIQGAVQAFTSLSSIPVVGPVLGGIAAAAALVSGYANVDKIRNTKYEGGGGEGGGGGAAPAPPAAPSMFAEGGMVSGAGTGVSDSIAARLSNGESVINARSTAQFGGLLSLINEAGGGRPFAEGGVSNGNLNTPVIKTYVLASDVSSQQEADFRIQQVARL
jgi:hypothetical protein